MALVFTKLSGWEDDNDLVVCISRHGKSYWLNYKKEAPLLLTEQLPRRPLAQVCGDIGKKLENIKHVCLSGYLMELVHDNPGSSNLSWILQEILLNLPNLSFLTILLPFQQQQGHGQAQGGVTLLHWKNLVNIMITSFLKFFKLKGFKPPCRATFDCKEISFSCEGVNNDNENDRHRRRHDKVYISIRDTPAYSSSYLGNESTTRGGSFLDPLICRILQDMPTLTKLNLCNLNADILEDTFHTIVNTSNLQELEFSTTSLGPFEVSTLVNAIQQQQEPLTSSSSSSSSTTTTTNTSYSDHQSNKRQRICSISGNRFHQLTDLCFHGIRIRQDQIRNLFEGLEETESNKYNSITFLYISDVTIYPSYERGKKEFWNVIFSFLQHNNTLRYLTLGGIRDSSGLQMTSLMDYKSDEEDDDDEDDSEEEEEREVERGEDFPFVAKGFEIALKNYNHTISTLDVVQRGENIVFPRTIRQLLHLNHFKVRPLMEDISATTTTQQDFLDVLIQALERRDNLKARERRDNLKARNDPFLNGGGGGGESSGNIADESGPDVDDDNDGTGSTSSQETDDSYEDVDGFAHGSETDVALMNCFFPVFRANPTLVKFLEPLLAA